MLESLGFIFNGVLIAMKAFYPKLDFRRGIQVCNNGLLHRRGGFIVKCDFSRTDLRSNMANAKNAQKAPENFETAMRELEQLIASMENGQMPLEASLQAYQRGAFLVKFCQAQLQAVQEQVKIVEADIVRPFDLNE